MQMQLSKVAAQMNAEYVGEDVTFSQVSTDTRTLMQGDLFVALQGENFDGHDCLQQAQDAGAVAAMVSRLPESSLPLLKVGDTRLGLGELASIWRKHFSIPLAAVTGSNGKTTVKEMIAAIMRQGGDVLATFGNLNNDIGVPLTLLRLQDQHCAAVIEMGANHAGEIKYLCSLASPTVAVITNAAAAHLEGFGSLEGVAKAKGELFSGLEETGIVVMNADDPFAPLWMRLAGNRKIIRFGLDKKAEVSADWVQTDGSLSLDLQTPDGSCSLRLPLPGRHNVMNALAAVAVSQAMGADLNMIKTGLESIEPVGGRLQILAGLPGMQLLNDTYNANPDSFAAAIEVLAGLPGDNKWLVLGDMGELGENAAQLHADCARIAHEHGVDRLYATGELSKDAVRSFGESAYWFPTKEDLVKQLCLDWQGEGALLVKGSRSMRMEQVVKQLQAGGQ